MTAIATIGIFLPPPMPNAACADHCDLPWVGEVGGPPVTPRQVRAMRAICDDCPHLEACREWATTHREQGFWGGTTGTERAALGGYHR